MLLYVWVSGCTFHGVVACGGTPQVSRRGFEWKGFVLLWSSIWCVMMMPLMLVTVPPRAEGQCCIEGCPKHVPSSPAGETQGNLPDTYIKTHLCIPSLVVVQSDYFTHHSPLQVRYQPSDNNFGKTRNRACSTCVYIWLILGNLRYNFYGYYPTYFINDFQ